MQTVSEVANGASFEKLKQEKHPVMWKLPCESSAGDHCVRVRFITHV